MGREKGRVIDGQPTPQGKADKGNDVFPSMDEFCFQVIFDFHGLGKGCFGIFTLLKVDGFCLIFNVVHL